jgi:hypothetical protein
MRILSFLISFLLVQISFAQTDLERALFDLPNVSFKKIDTPDGYSAAYELMIKQPIDHQHPEKGHFYQQVYLSHRGFNRPTVLITEGYQAPGNRVYELSELLEANQLRVEHRFFEESTPDPKEWKYLNMEQATADYHAIKELFDDLYSEKWVSTGISKGGMTTMYYKYFYPDDVSVAVPYVGPIDTTFEDPRIYAWLAAQGTEECRKDIKAIQMRLLKDKKEAIERLKWFEKASKRTYDYLGFEQAYEIAVLEYPFSFWQVGYKCEEIPDPKAPLDTILEYFNNVVGLSLFSDQEIVKYASHYYQAATQTGYYGYLTAPYKGLLSAVPERPHAAFVPDKMKVAYDNTLSKKVYNWLTTKGDNIIYIYGGNDTWTSAGIPPSKGVDSKWYILDGRSHFDARIRNFSEAQKEDLIETLEKWLDMDLED